MLIFYLFFLYKRKMKNKKSVLWKNNNYFCIAVFVTLRFFLVISIQEKINNDVKRKIAYNNCLDLKTCNV